MGLQSTGYGGTKNFEAYDHYLRGLLLRNVGDPMVGVNELSQAVTLDPDYARAWAELTNAWGTVARLAKTPAEQAPAMKKMDEASSTAERLAPKMWFGHTPRGWYFIGSNDWINADIAHHKALAIGDVPDPEFYQTASAFASQVGRTTVSAQLKAKLFAIDPRYRNRQGLTIYDYLPLRKYDELWAAYDASRKENPAFDFLREYMAMWAAWDEGKIDRVRTQLDAIKVANPFYGELVGMLDQPDMVLGKLQTIADGPEIGRGGFSNAALLAGQYDDPELAVKLLRRAYLGPGWAGNFMTWFPQLSDARKTASFKQFVRDIGWEEMYRQSGDWGDFCKPLGATDFECS